MDKVCVGMEKTVAKSASWNGNCVTIDLKNGVRDSVELSVTTYDQKKGKWDRVKVHEGE
jgi:hypothetical protein